jgi:hypothetical protein
VHRQLRRLVVNAPCPALRARQAHVVEIVEREKAATPPGRLSDL